MSQDVVVGNQTYRKRNVFAVWLGLPLITLGIYSFVWLYKVNDEARRFLGDESIRPALSVLAFIPGFILILPPYIAIYRLGGRIARMEQAAGVPGRTSGGIGVLLTFFFSLHLLYYQSHLNGVWDRYAQTVLTPPPPALPPPVV